jgi:choline-sulfatase
VISVYLSRKLILAMVAGATLAWGGCQKKAPPQDPGPRDIILITIDTLRADRVGACGGPPGLTPALDALGHEGAAFLDATAQVPLTLPSHTSILTGRYPPAHGVHDNAGFALSDRVPTLASVLHDAGYHTAAFVASFVLRGSTGLAHGFDSYDDRFEGVGRTHLTLSSLERRGPEVAREAARWLATAKRPYFLWVHFYDPHAPYEAPQAFAEKFPGRPYDAEVATSDFAVATLLASLTPDRRAQTLIVATGDHGESLGEHGEPEHGILLYDATLHVPLVIQGPGVPAGTVVRTQVRHVDLMPTILDVARVAAPAGMEGRSLLPLFAPGAKDEPPISYAESRFGELHFGWSPLRSARDGTWKYIDAPSPELYQLAVDAGEVENRQSSRAQTSAALARAVRAMASPPGGAVVAPAPAADAAERLRSLGYLSGHVALDSDGSAAALADPKQEIGRYVRYVTVFNDAMALLDTGHGREAESRFRALTKTFPRSFEPHQYLARALNGRGAYDEAIRELDFALALAPQEPELYFDAARTLGQAGRFAAAGARVDAGLQLEPSSFYGWLTRGLVAAAAGQRSTAEGAYREALRLNPHLAVAHFELGRMAEARSDRGTARTEYQLAVDDDVSLAEARRALERVSR